MTMFIAYTRLTVAELEADIPKAIKGIEDWFEANPDRDDCNTQLWMGKELTVSRENIETEVRALAAAIETKP